MTTLLLKYGTIRSVDSLSFHGCRAIYWKVIKKKEKRENYQAWLKRKIIKNKSIHSSFCLYVIERERERIPDQPPSENIISHL